jgi:hypothetical protein
VPSLALDANGRFLALRWNGMHYCGAGRPGAVYIRERPVDQAAREMHIDPAELRRRNAERLCVDAAYKVLSDEAGHL